MAEPLPLQRSDIEKASRDGEFTLVREINMAELLINNTLTEKPRITKKKGDL